MAKKVVETQALIQAKTTNLYTMDRIRGLSAYYDRTHGAIISWAIFLLEELTLAKGLSIPLSPYEDSRKTPPRIDGAGCFIKNLVKENPPQLGQILPAFQNALELVAASKPQATKELAEGTPDEVAPIHILREFVPDGYSAIMDIDPTSDPRRVRLMSNGTLINEHGREQKMVLIQGSVISELDMNSVPMKVRVIGEGLHELRDERNLDFVLRADRKLIYPNGTMVDIADDDWMGKLMSMIAEYQPSDF